MYLLIYTVLHLSCAFFAVSILSFVFAVEVIAWCGLQFCSNIFDTFPGQLLVRDDLTLASLIC